MGRFVWLVTAREAYVEFESNEDIVNVLGETMLNLKKLELNTFTDKNSAIFLFDGFDEVDPSYKQLNETWNWKLSNWVHFLIEIKKIFFNMSKQSDCF